MKLSFLKKRLVDPELSMMVSPAEALGKLGDRSGMPFLLSAAEALGRVGDEKAVPHLER